MKTILLFFIFLCTSLFAQTSVWKVQKGEDILYIGGTIHMLRSSDYPLPNQFDKAYNLSNKIYFETDLSESLKLEYQEMFLSKMMLENNKTLSTILSSKTYERLAQSSAKLGINIKDFEVLKPGMSVLVLTMAKLQSLGVDTKGVDFFYEKKAFEDNKRLGKFETVEEQLNYLASFGQGNENSFVNKSLDDLEEIEALFLDIISFWRNGDTKKLSELFIKDMKINYPALYNSLIVERNNKWLPQIKNLFGNKDTEFILVGIGHLLGVDGVIYKLKKAGYKVEKLD